ncbi:MAG: glycosyltransferase, partial [Bacteroidota bacterium]
MLNQIFDKIRKVKRSQGQMWMNGNFTFFRLFIMLKSRTGQKKTLKFIIKVIQFILQLVFGIKTKETKDYELWMKKNYPDEQKLNQYKNELSSFSFQPKISIILPVYNTPINYLIEALDSVINQIYPNWELCISDDCSTDNMIREMIIEYAANDNRIKYVFRDVNGHISLNSNSALEIATGDYITFLDHDDKLSLDALFQNVKILNNNREIDFI